MINVEWILLGDFFQCFKMSSSLHLQFYYVKYNASVGLITFYFGNSFKSTRIFIPWMRYSDFSVAFKKCHFLTIIVWKIPFCLTFLLREPTVCLVPPPNLSLLSMNDHSQSEHILYKYWLCWLGKARNVLPTSEPHSLNEGTIIAGDSW